MTRRKLLRIFFQPWPLSHQSCCLNFATIGSVDWFTQGDSIVQNLRMKTDHDERSLLFPTICESENSQLSEISPSQFILLCLSPYSTQFLYPYKLPISLYLTPGILVIKYQVEFWGKVSGSVVTCQYWIGRTKYYFSIYRFLLAIRKYTVIRSPLVISDFLTLW